MNITVSTEVTKLCPYVDEIDHGDVTFTFTGRAPELHALAGHLRSFEQVRVSHEIYTSRLYDRYKPVEVTTRWVTAGLNVTVTVKDET